jgi:hypothetical protein
VVNETRWTGDSILSSGQTYLIANRTFVLLGRIFVDGAVLIVRNATFTSVPGMGDTRVKNGGCLEFTDSLVTNGGVLGLGAGADQTGAADDSSVFINRSTIQMGMDVAGSNETVKIGHTVYGNGVGLAGPGANFVSSTRVEISDSLVMNIGLGFNFGAQVANISGLRPGHFETWDLRTDLSLPTMPYDVSLKNVTVIPNTVGPGPAGRYLGWSIGVTQGSYYGPGGPCAWPKITIRNSELSGLGLGFQYNPQLCSYNQPITFSGIPSKTPLSVSFFDSIHLVNTTVNGQLSVNMRNLNVTFVDAPTVQLYTNYYGKSTLTFINSSLLDGGAIGCECTIISANSRWGGAERQNLNLIPYHDILPLNYSDAASTGGTGFFDSNVTVIGSFAPELAGWTNSRATRFYPVSVSDANGLGVANAKVSLSRPDGTGSRWWTTDGEGHGEIPISFNDGNWTDHLLLTVSAGKLSNTTNISFRTTTPITILLAPPPLPSATAGSNHASIDVGQSASFYCDVVGGLPPYSFSWSFGDGNIGMSKNPSHQYDSMGSKKAICTVTDDLGRSANANTIVTVNPNPTVTTFLASTTSLEQGQAVSFFASATGGTGQLIYSYRGLPLGCESSNVDRFSCNPSLPGEYAITVTVTDQVGKTASSSLTVGVSARASSLPPVQNYTAVIVLLILGIMAVVSLLERRHSRAARTTQH